MTTSAPIGYSTISGDPYLSTSFPSAQYLSLLHFPAAGFVLSLPGAPGPCRANAACRMRVARAESHLGPRNSHITTA